MSDDLRHFTMRELVARTGVLAPTIRYYLTLGILPPPTRASSNRFFYDERHVEVIRFIRLLRERKHLSLESIAQLLPDLVPDLFGNPDGGVFHPEMWGAVIATRSRVLAGPSVAERLVEAGLIAFSQRGYGEVAIDDICQATAIAKGSFYRHFASKEDLFFAVARRSGEKIVGQIEALVALLDSEAVSNATLEKAAVQAVTPFASILFDLAAQAARGRPEHVAVLREVAEMVNGAQVGGFSGDAHLFASALGGAARALSTDEALSPGILASALQELA